MASLVVSSIGLLQFMFAASLLPPLLVSALYRDGQTGMFAVHMLVGMMLGLLLWWPRRRLPFNLRLRDGFLIVALFWLVLALLGALPLYESTGMSLADAVFESASAITTTGATVMAGLDSMPPSLLYFRQQLQWLGGIGVVVSAVAILPLLGIGGMQLYRAETPGPMKDDKLTPRIAHTARALCGIYLVLTFACALGYWLAGMSPFDAVAHSLSTVSTGGFSTHDASIAYFDSLAVELVCVVFMLAGATNFAIHYRAATGRAPGAYLRDLEVRTFLGVVLLATLAVAVTLELTGYVAEAGASLRVALFMVASVITSTGFGTSDISVWPLYLPLFFMLLSFMGGCGGSTSGGMKTLRWMLLFLLARDEVRRLLHRNAVVPLKYAGRAVPVRVQDAVWGFFASYIAVFVIFLLAMMAGGMDQVTAFGAVATCINNLGPGLGEVGTTFSTVPDGLLWPLSVLMIVGRLEVFTVLVLLHPSFWKS